MSWFENAFDDVRFGLRMGLCNPGFTALAVLSLALGVGSTTAIFSVAKAVLINQLPYRNSGRIVALSESGPGGTAFEGVGGWTANEWRSRARSFESISLYGDGAGVLIENGEAEVLRGMRVGHDFFETLGVSLLLGRTFQADDNRWPRNNVIILSSGLWMRRFGGDPHIVGRVLNLSRESYRVIGVLPADFYPLRMSNPAERPDIFLPLGYDPREASACRSCFGGNAIGRLKPGVDIQHARAELNGIMREIARDDPSDYRTNASVLVEPLRDRMVDSIQTALWVLLGAVLFVLLIVCANIGNLLLARATGRTKEIAIRAALGCSGWRLARQLLTESLLLSALGGAGGVLSAWQGIALLKSLAPKELARIDEVRIDVTVLLFAIGISLTTGLLFGIAPAFRASRMTLGDTLHRANAGSGASSRGGLRSLLVIGEVALAFVLALGTGLLAKSFLRLTQADSGFDAHHVLTMTLFLTGSQYNSPAATLNDYRRVLERVRAVPGVVSAAMAENVPLSHTNPTKLRLEGAPALTDSEAPSTDLFATSPDYFRVLRIPLKDGRFFTDQDGLNGPAAAIVSESFAKARFPGARPIGRRIQLGPQRETSLWFTIIGVVGDVRNIGFDKQPDQAVYIPQSLERYTRLLVVCVTQIEQ